MENINNIGSTFGIDVRRKIYCTGNTSDWLKGEIDPNCLKRIAWQFEEVFTSATDQYGKAYDELTAGLREALKTFTKLLRGVSLGKDINSTSAESGESKSTQSALMEAAGAIAAFTGSDVDDKILAEAFMIAPKYNIPTRSAVPKLQIPISAGGIKVCFSYGKAGLFNAKEEVWEPIKKIMASLSPKIPESTKYEGLLDIEDGKTIPFEFQSKYYFIKSAAGALNDEFGNTTIKGAIKSFSNATSSISTTVKEAMEVQLRIDREKSKQGDAYKKADAEISDLRDDGDDKGLTSDDLFANKRGVWEIDDVIWRGPIPVRNHLVAKYRLRDALDDYKKAEKKLSGFEYKEEGKFSDVALSKRDEIKDRYTDNSLYHEKAEVLDKVSTSGGDITSVLTSIATIRPRLVGRATVDQFSKVSNSIKTFCMMLTGGDGNVFFSVDDISKKINDGTLHPLLTIKGIPTKVEASFDYSNVDENGYPMSGTIEIKSIWSVETYGKSVILND